MIVTLIINNDLELQLREACLYKESSTTLARHSSYSSWRSAKYAASATFTVNNYIVNSFPIILIIVKPFLFFFFCKLGINRFVRDTHFLLGKELGKVWILSVTLFIPTVLLALFIETLVNYTPLRIGDYVFPTSAMGK